MNPGKASAVILSCLIPGWGNAAFGDLKTGLQIQLTFYSTLLLLALSRVVVIRGGLYIILVTILCAHILSLIRFLQKSRNSQGFLNKVSLGSFLLYPLFCAGAMITVLLFKHWVLGLHVYKVKSSSMEPTIRDSDIIIVDTWRYLFKEPETGDIVLFSINNNDSVTYVKRITEPPEPPKTTTERKYFVLGDNVNKSMDSRHFGMIRKSDIKGKMTYILLGMDN